MSKTDTVSPLRQRMLEDMAARKLNPHTQRSHISSCRRFAAWFKRSPDTATADEVRRFQLHLVESGDSRASGRIGVCGSQADGAANLAAGLLDEDGRAEAGGGRGFPQSRPDEPHRHAAHLTLQLGEVKSSPSTTRMGQPTLMP